MTDLTFAERQRDAGIARALDHAEREHPSWGDLAYAFLLRYARAHATFISEDVSDASRGERGMPYQPSTDRAWGAIYRKAQRHGVIRMVGCGKSRRRHASLCPLWQSQIYRGHDAD